MTSEKNTILLSARIPSEIIAQIDEFARAENRSRSGQAVQLLQEALRAREGKK